MLGLPLFELLLTLGLTLIPSALLGGEVLESFFGDLVNELFETNSLGPWPSTEMSIYNRIGKKHNLYKWRREHLSICVHLPPDFSDFQKAQCVEVLF